MTVSSTYLLLYSYIGHVDKLFSCCPRSRKKQQQYSRVKYIAVVIAKTAYKTQLYNPLSFNHILSNLVTQRKSYNNNVITSPPKFLIHKQLVNDNISVTVQDKDIVLIEH